MPRPGFPRGTYDEALPCDGAWWLCGPFGYDDGKSMDVALPPESAFDTTAAYDGGHKPGSGWLTEGARQRGRERARWVLRESQHGFIDFNHVFQPVKLGVACHESGVAYARCVLDAPEAMPAVLRVTFDDVLALRVNDAAIRTLGHHTAFRTVETSVMLKAGPNVVLIKQSNTPGFNHGGWLFNFQATGPRGERLMPRAEESRHGG
jgi:hypothetical protein